MTIEEKARAYDEAIKKAKKLYEQGTITESLNYVFPELKESKDERVRKALLELVHDTTGDELWVDYNVHKEDALAWLEKQGKQKSIDDLTQQEAMDIAVAKCFESGGVCTNPLIDCNDCLKRFGDGSTTITTSQTILKDEQQ